MASLFTALRRFTAHFEGGQHRPNKKWLRDMLVGIVMSRSVMLSEIARSLREDDRWGQPRKLIHTEKRLSYNLNSDRLDEDALMEAWWSAVEKFSIPNDGEGVVVAVDYTDISKPFARPLRPQGMELACVCWDGSKNATGLGYPVVQIDATSADGTRFPILYKLYSHRSDEYRSFARHFIPAIKEAAEHVGPRAWWTLDRGFDNGRMFDGLDRAGVRWITRLKHAEKSSRHLITVDSGTVSIFDLCFMTFDRWRTEMVRGRGRKRRVTELTFGSRKVWVRGRHAHERRGQARTLVVVWGFGVNPLVLLAGEYLPGRKAALEILYAYLRRWKAEETTRAMKDGRRWGVRLEDVRALKFRGIERVLFLTAMVYLFLGEVQMAEIMAGRLVQSVASFSETVDDIRYRLVRGAGMVLAKIKPGRLRAWRRECMSWEPSSELCMVMSALLLGLP